MKKGLRILLFIVTLALFAAVTTLVYSSASAGRHVLTCNGLDVQLPKGGRFVSENDIKEYLKDYYGSYLGERLDSVDLSRIEKALDIRSAVRKSEAWITDDGILHISVSQREPAIRFQGNGFSCYADRTGFIFPHQGSYSPLVPVVDGALPLHLTKGYKGEAGSDKEKEWIMQMLDLLDYMKKSRTWADNISQINVQPNGDLVLYPRDGAEHFIFGAPDKFKEKFSRMEDYYRYVKPSKDSAYYRSVNVKYEGQIVCRQK